MKDFLTVREASRPEHIGRSPEWIRVAIRLGKLKGVKAGNTYLVPLGEIKRLRKNPIKITRKEMLS